MDALGLDGSVLAFAVALSIGATVLFGAIPAFRSMAPDVADLLKPALAHGSGPRGGRRLREIMVVVEVALALVLLVGAGLMVRSFARLSEVDPGFRRDGVVSVAVALPRSRHDRSEWKAFFETLVEPVEALPGVTRAGAVSDLPMHDVGLGLELEFTVTGLEAVSPTARPNADVRLVIPGYFDVMGIRVVRGRDFDRLDASGDRRVAMVNQTLVERYFGNIGPIGLALLGEVEVVGVVADIHHESLASRYESEVHLPYGRPATGEMHVVVHSELDTAAVASGVGAVLEEVDPQLAPSKAASVADLLWQSAARPRFNAALLAGLALASALLAVVGTYGIVAYTVSQRRGEIGLRMALGADSRATVLLILRQALRIVVTGAMLGTLGALGATRFLRGLLFEVEPTDPTTYVVVLIASVVVGGLAAWLSARRATRVDPVVALRSG